MGQSQLARRDLLSGLAAIAAAGAGGATGILQLLEGNQSCEEIIEAEQAEIDGESYEIEGVKKTETGYILTLETEDYPGGAQHADIGGKKMEILDSEPLEDNFYSIRLEVEGGCKDGYASS